MESLGRQIVPLRAGDYDANTWIQPSSNARALLAGTAPPSTVTSRFEVIYTGFTAPAKKAFQAAVDVWSTVLTSPVPIKISAAWNALGEGVLGQAGPEAILRDFTGAQKPNTWYPVALANKLAGSDLNTAAVDISAEFNADFTNWYFGTDGATPVGQYDLMSVVLHEIGHGLGFVGTGQVAGGQGSWGIQSRPLIWDQFIENGAGKNIIDTSLFPNPSPQLAAQLQGGALFFTGLQARSANGGVNVPTYAPNPFEGGSSYSHLDEATFPAGNPHSLMTPQLGRAEAIHKPGAVGRALLRDLGW